MPRLPFRIAAAVGVLLLGGLAARADKTGSGLALAPGDTAPGIRGRTPAGTVAEVDWGTAEFSLVNFWATWCEPCREEMPRLEQLYRENGGRLQIVGVLVDRPSSPGDLLKILGAAGTTYLTLRPEPGVERAWGGIGIMPTTFLVDGHGRILRRYVGASKAQFEGLVTDVGAALDGRALPPQVLTDASSD